MVQWTEFAVILVLSGLACSTSESEFRKIPRLSFDLIENGFEGYCAKIPGCRYSKLLSALKDNLNINAGAVSYNVKVKNNLGTDRIDYPEVSESIDREIHSDDNALSTNDAAMDAHVLDMIDKFDYLKSDEMKRGVSSPAAGCDCRVTNELLDLGHLYYPRYLLNAVCEKDDESFEYPPKCWRGAQCKPLEYKVRVLTHRSHNDNLQKDPTTSLLPDSLRPLWKFKTVTVAAGCFCS